VDSFRDLLKYLYTGIVEINRRHILDLIYCSKLYRVQSLHRRCIELAEFTKEDALDIFPSVLDLGEEELIKKCKTVISQFTHYILTTQVALEITKDTLIEIISTSPLQITEVALFEFVMQWIEHHRASPEIISEIIFLIRFPLIPPKTINRDCQTLFLRAGSALH